MYFLHWFYSGYSNTKGNYKWVQEKGILICVHPPRAVIASFLKKTGDITDEDVQNVAKETALKETDVRLWVDHLNNIQTRRTMQVAWRAAEKRTSRKETDNKGTAC